eukprot:8782175-Lingulodinium_polyedra.AAC.1
MKPPLGRSCKAPSGRQTRPPHTQGGMHRTQPPCRKAVAHSRCNTPASYQTKAGTTGQTEAGRQA